MYDAAYAPASPPAWDVVAGYIGGDAYHVWTDAEWASQRARWRLPIYVRSHPAGRDPHADAAAALTWLRAHGVPQGCVVALDLETAINRAYVHAFDADITAGGYLTLGYGSLSTIFQNGATSGGTWAAHYTGEPHMEAGAVATQYASDQQLGVPWDASLIDDSVPLWDTRPSQEDDMAQVSSLGADGKQVINADDHADVKFTVEYTDKSNLHADGGASVVVATAPYWVIADAQFTLTGLAPGATLNVAWTRVRDDGTYLNDAWGPNPYTADDRGVIKGTIGGQFGVDDTNRLRLRVYNSSDRPVTVASCMAKASLFKY